LIARPPLTLAEQHVLLLWQVTARAEELLTAAADGRWPGAELTALAGYAQAEVLRRGEQVELQSGTSLDPVWRETSELSPAGAATREVRGDDTPVLEPGRDRHTHQGRTLSTTLTRLADLAESTAARRHRSKVIMTLVPRGPDRDCT
jgi:hypothetical protein